VLFGTCIEINRSTKKLKTLQTETNNSINLNFLKMKTIKTLTAIVLAVLTLTVVSNQTFAQATETENVTLTANLNTTLALELLTSSVTFTFDDLSEYQDGIGENDEVSLVGSVASTADWKLEFKATGSLLHSDLSTTIPLSQVGIRGTITGDYEGDNRSTEPGASAPLALDNNYVTLFNTANGTTNAGSADDNQFTTYWEMGTQNGNMLGNSIWNANYKRGTYTTTVDFKVTENIVGQ
jgi:hypothetical protein